MRYGNGRCGRFIRDPCVNKNDCSEDECDGVCYLPNTNKIN
jgi:hypothetical protein